MALSPVDQSLRDAIWKLADLYGEVPPERVDEGMARVVNAFGLAAIEDRVVEGYLFDANHERRMIEFDLAIQMLVEDILDGLPATTVLRQGEVVYRVGFPRTIEDDRGHRSLLRGRNSVLASDESDIGEVVGRFYEATTEQRLQLVSDREWILAAKARAGAERGAPAAAAEQSQDGRTVS